MIKNIKISLKPLIVLILSIAISNVLSELATLREIVVIEDEEEEVENNSIIIESNIYKISIQSTSANTGDDRNDTISIDTLPKGNRFKLFVKSVSKPISVGEHPLNSIPLFIRYCSLIIYA